MKTSMVDKKIDEKEAEEVKKDIYIYKYNHYFDKTSDIMKKTQLKIEDIFGDIIFKDSISTEQITKLSKFWAQIRWIFFLI